MYAQSPKPHPVTPSPFLQRRPSSNTLSKTSLLCFSHGKHKTEPAPKEKHVRRKFVDRGQVKPLRMLQLQKWAKAKLHVGETPSKSTMSRISSKSAILLSRSNPEISKKSGTRKGNTMALRKHFPSGFVTNMQQEKYQLGIYSPKGDQAASFGQ